MARVNLELSDEEFLVRKHYAEQNNLLVVSVLRTIITESFSEWKIVCLINEYCTGQLGFKKAWKLSGLSFNSWLRHLEESEADLKLPEIVEQRSEELAITLNPEDFKKNQ